MASTLPQPSRPAANNPATSVPPLPVLKTRKSLPAPNDSLRSASPAQPTKLRAPSSPRPTLTKSPLSNSTTNVTTQRSVSTGLAPSSPDKSLRRTISIAAFPQPPKSGISRPPTAASSASNMPTIGSSSGSIKARKGSRLSTGTTSSYRSSKTPSLLNGNGDGKSIPTGADPDASPSQSRSSSAQDSYSTSATTYEDAEDATTTTSSTKTAGAKSSTKEAKGNVIVSVRVRPDANTTEAARSVGEWGLDGRRGLISYKGKEGGDYHYDNVFTTMEQNARVYDSAAKRLVRRVMEGYHGTVFAYGMTGTGKTFSMQGTATSPGVIPLAITDIFSFIRETPHREFLLRVSYLEIYNEKIHDLLSAPASGAQQEEIKLREDSKRGVYASPLKEEIVQSPTQLLRVIARGDHARRTGSTQFNARSSRSHAVVQIVVESRERAPVASTQDKRSAIVPGGVRVSTLSLIDLAGSERAAEDKERRTEGAHINKSLLTLGTIISRLSETKDKNGNATEKERHLPYRDSKLTRLLQPALSGNSLVSILCTVQLTAAGSSAAANSHSGETLNTLKFAARAKNSIVSHAKKAEEALGAGGNDGSRVLLERYRMEIQSLRTQLDTHTKAQTEKESKMEDEQFEKESQVRHEEQMLEMQLARTALKERIEHLNRLILSSKSTGVNSQGNFSALGRFSRMSSTNDSGSRSLRSSVSQSTLGAWGHSSMRPVSFLSMNSTDINGSVANDDDDDTMGEFGDGRASLQRHVTALQADLGDKNRYISTLEKRLLQARRSSHSRISTGIKANNNNNSRHNSSSGANNNNSAAGGAGGAGSNGTEAPDMAALLRERDMEINELKSQLDDKDRMLTALRSAARHRDLARVAGDTPEPKEKPDFPPPANNNDKRHSSTSNNSSNRSNRNSNNSSNSSNNNDTDNDNSNMKRNSDSAVPDATNTKQTPHSLETTEKEPKKRKSLDDMSRMLDEMIQDRVDSGQIVKGSRGSVRVAAADSRRTSAMTNGFVPGLSRSSPNAEDAAIPASQIGTAE